MLVGSDDDPYAGPEEHEEAATALGIELHRLSGAGHVNPDAGFGPWPFALEWLASAGALSTSG